MYQILVKLRTSDGHPLNPSVDLSVTEADFSAYLQQTSVVGPRGMYSAPATALSTIRVDQCHTLYVEGAVSTADITVIETALQDIVYQFDSGNFYLFILVIYYIVFTNSRQKIEMSKPYMIQLKKLF